jgi:Bacterial PH domain
VRNYLVFEPDRSLGLVFHFFAILLLIGISAWGIWQAVHSAIGPLFLLYLTPALLSIFLIPLLAYRLYSLLGAYYQIERDGMRLRWGLRMEDIPMDSLVWISPDTELERKLPLPWLRWPGAVLGVRRTAQSETIEFLASRSRRLVVIATQDKIYAISPTPPEIFIQNLRSFMELGSLSPVAARSIQPSFLVIRIWEHVSARILILAGVALNLALLVWVSVAIPARASIMLGFASISDPVPSVRLLLIPVISGFFFLADLFLGLFFYRRAVDPPPIESSGAISETPLLEPVSSTVLSNRYQLLIQTISRGFWSIRRGMSLVPGQYLAHLLWGSSVLVSTLFLLATYFILSYST